MVVLAPLMESAKDNRERLEYTAVPDIGDGLADAGRRCWRKRTPPSTR